MEMAQLLHLNVYTLTLILDQEKWKFHEIQVFQQLHETRKTFKVQIILLMYFCFNIFMTFMMN